jgi:hypothetical protein
MVWQFDLSRNGCLVLKVVWHFDLSRSGFALSLIQAEILY